MDSQGQGRLGRVVLFFLVLNLIVTVAGAGLEYWRSQPRTLAVFNADKIKLRGVGEVQGPSARAKDGAAGAEATEAEYITPDP